MIADNGVIDRDRMALPGPITTLPHYTLHNMVTGGGRRRGSHRPAVSLDPSLDIISDIRTPSVKAGRRQTCHYSNSFRCNNL